MRPNHQFLGDKMTTQINAPGMMLKSSPAANKTIVLATVPNASIGFEYDIAIVGMGYVGLPTALAHHSSGGSVLGFDVSTKRLDDISSRQVDLLPSDHERLSEALKSKALTLTSDPSELAKARAVIVCVPTPIDAHQVPDLSILASASKTVVEHAVKGQLILMTSTTYAGCTREMIVDPLLAQGMVPGLDVKVAFSPERINPGVADFTIEEVPRVVGGYSESCRESAVELLASYTGAVHRTSSMEVAEMTKLLENTFRAVNIAMANEFAEACKTLNLPVHEVIDSAATKPFGFMPFTPGPGVGGHCIPCDPHYLLWQLRRHNVNLPVVASAMEGIERRPHQAVARCSEVLSHHGKGLAGARILVVGLAYKPDVADLRESPALKILSRLTDAGAHVSFVDEHFAEGVTVQGQTYQHVAQPAESGADLVLLHTRHSNTDLSWIKPSLPVVDATYRAEELIHRVLL